MPGAPSRQHHFHTENYFSLEALNVDLKSWYNPINPFVEKYVI